MISLPRDILEAMDSNKWFGSSFAGPSWDRHRAILRAAFALPMGKRDLDLFREVAERDPPQRQVRELWVIAGRGSGKDSLASLVACYFAVFGKFNRFLRPGERAVCAVIAVDRDQSRICFRYIRALLDHPLLQELVQRDDGTSTIELANGSDIVVLTNSYRAVRGRSIAVAVLDEVAFWRSDDFANPDEEVFNALEPGLARVPGSMLIGISTAYRRSGLLFRKWRSHFGKPDDVLVVKGTTPQFNPLIPYSVIERALARDPEAAAAEWLSEWRSDLADFISREIVDALVPPGVFEVPYLSKHNYVAFVDPSGGSSDSFTLAIAHAENDVGVLDCLREWRAPFSPEMVVEELCQTLRAYQVHRVCGDRYAGSWPAEQFEKRGIGYDASEKSKSDLYREFLPLLNARRVELLDNQRLVSQLCSLERRTGRGTGRDVVDHPPGAHDDIANAAAGALVGVAALDWGRVWDQLAANAAGPAPPPPPPPRRVARVRLNDPDPPTIPAGYILIDMPRQLNVTLPDRVYPLRPGRQAVPPEVAAHWIVRLIVKEQDDAA